MESNNADTFFSLDFYHHQVKKRKRNASQNHLNEKNNKNEAFIFHPQNMNPSCFTALAGQKGCIS